MSKITKGNRTITDYLQSLKVIADQLASLGKPIENEDFIEKILDWLDSNYKSFKDSINGRDTTISFEELHEKLINCELTIEQETDVASTLPITAFAAQTIIMGLVNPLKLILSHPLNHLSYPHQTFHPITHDPSLANVNRVVNKVT